MSWLHTVLVSPCCQANLTAAPGKLHCADCGTAYSQPSNEWVNLYPDQSSGTSVAEWNVRQLEMEAWYRELIADRGRAAGCFHYDYEPYRSLLEALPGRVLDIGGGTGVARHFLAAATRYMVVDPSLEWLSDDWSALSEHFPCLSSPACFVRGLGEQLPCRDCSFDSALSLWSLNHVRNPEAVFGEVHRVLEPGGRFLVILEDMIPCWKDALIPAHRAIGGLGWPWLLIRKARLAMRGQQWSLQSDHIRIHERQITAWISGLFAIKTREWIGDYLAFEFVRAGKSLNSGDR